MVNCTCHGNSAETVGVEQGRGGAIAVVDSLVNATSCSFAHNTASGCGTVLCCIRKRWSFHGSALCRVCLQLVCDMWPKERHGLSWDDAEMPCEAFCAGFDNPSLIACRFGGAIDASAPSFLTISGSDFISNRAGGSGGAIALTGVSENATAYFNNVRFARNRAPAGADAVAAVGASVAVTAGANGTPAKHIKGRGVGGFAWRAQPAAASVRSATAPRRYPELLTMDTAWVVTARQVQSCGFSAPSLQSSF
jgi:hypothetical protein